MNPFLSGEYAKNFFENEKRRYLKRMNAVKKLDKSGTSSVAVNKAKGKVDAYFCFSLAAILSQGKRKAIFLKKMKRIVMKNPYMEMMLKEA